MAPCWLDILIYHEDVVALYEGSKEFPGFKESTLPTITDDVGRNCIPKLNIEVSEETDISQLTASLRNGIEGYVLPLFEQCKTLEGMLSFLQADKNWPLGAFDASAISLLLGKPEKAVEFAELRLQQAAANIRNPNDLPWCERTLHNIRANYEKFHM